MAKALTSPKTWGQSWEDFVRAPKGGPFGEPGDSYWVPSSIREGVGDMLNLIQTPGQIIQGERSFGSEQDIVDATPGMIDLAMGAYTGGGLLSRGRVDPNMVNAFVYQGGPHKYGPAGAAQSLKHIGKGEGAQAYGWGRYDAGNPKVAEQYKKQLSGDFWATPDGELLDPSTLEHLNARSAIKQNPDIEKVLPRLKDIANKQSGTEPGEMLTRDIQKLEALQKKGGLTEAPGHIYKHDLPDEDIARYLDFDEVLGVQPKSVEEALAKTDWYEYAQDSLENRLPHNPTGSDLIQWLSEDYDKREISELLKAAGIPGLKYLDGGSRSAGSGSHNYITWDQDVLNRMRLLERNGEDMTKALMGAK